MKVCKTLKHTKKHEPEFIENIKQLVLSKFMIYIRFKCTIIHLGQLARVGFECL